MSTDAIVVMGVSGCGKTTVAKELVTCHRARTYAKGCQNGRMATVRVLSRPPQARVGRAPGSCNLPPESGSTSPSSTSVPRHRAR